MGLVVMTTVSFYLITIYTPTFGRTVLQLTPADSLLVAMAVGASNFVWLPIAGALSDRIGRKPILVGFAILAIVTAYPTLVWLAASPSFGKMLTALVWLSFLYAGYNGAMVVALTEIVPAEVRDLWFLAGLQPRDGDFRRLHAGRIGNPHQVDRRQGGPRALDDSGGRHQPCRRARCLPWRS